MGNVDVSEWNWYFGSVFHLPLPIGPHFGEFFGFCRHCIAGAQLNLYLFVCRSDFVQLLGQSVQKKAGVGKKYIKLCF